MNFSELLSIPIFKMFWAVKYDMEVKAVSSLAINNYLNGSYFLFKFNSNISLLYQVDHQISLFQIF